MKVSKPGASIEVYEIILTEDGERALTTESNGIFTESEKRAMRRKELFDSFKSFFARLLK